MTNELKKKFSRWIQVNNMNDATLIKIIKQILTNFKVTTTSDYGLSPDCIEAVTFAWLAKKRLENQPSNIPTVTGATERVILGGIYSPIKKNS